MQIFNLYLIKPSHYDDDGYVIQWLRSAMPSNTLAVLYGLAADAGKRKVLGEDVELRITAMDETNTRVRVDRLARQIRRDGGRALVGLVGVQSNQYPRAMDIARQLRARDVPVAIGGFHVSGCMAMLPELTPELQEALDLGISLFAGEAETRFDDFLRDAWRGQLKPIYNYIDDLPNVEGEPTPFLPVESVGKTAGSNTSFDAGRGCPFVCSFCSIINVHGRKSRFRSVADVERVIRANLAQGIHRFFITDDNFARNKNWEAILDHIIALRQSEGIEVHFTIQVDTQAHRIPRFIEKCARAGVTRAFVGMESINPDNLASSGKKQNKITEFRRNLQAWREVRVPTDVGYIIGFPGDTPESIRRDIRILQKELPIDRIEFTSMTPLPGSQDHKEMYLRGDYMDPDLNNYDLSHFTIDHPSMTREQWRDAYRQAWQDYYSHEHIVTIMKRGWATDLSLGKILGTTVAYNLLAGLEGVHPLEAGVIRRRFRRDRRPGLPLENPLLFYPRHYWSQVVNPLKVIAAVLRYKRVRRQLEADPESRNYTDQALMPATEEELGELEMFTGSAAAQAAVEVHKIKRQGRRGATQPTG